MRRDRTLQLTVLLALLLIVAIPLPAQTDNALTNADLVRMARAGISENIILREIQMSRTNFATSAAALVELKNQGVSNRVLDAVLDSRMGASGSKSEPAHVVVAQAASPGAHHLPTFEADVRVNATKHEKVSMGHNQIKVEQSGVPIFSLKWKEPKNTGSGK